MNGNEGGVGSCSLLLAEGASQRLHSYHTTDISAVVLIDLQGDSDLIRLHRVPDVLGGTLVCNLSPTVIGVNASQSFVARCFGKMYHLLLFRFIPSTIMVSRRSDV
jgi:hypothetical protein